MGEVEVTAACWAGLRADRCVERGIVGVVCWGGSVAAVMVVRSQMAGH